MAKVQVLFWQEIPSLVEASDETGTVKIQLSDRYQQLIDHIAMMRKLAGTDAYLEHWSKGQASERPGAAKAVAEQVASELEAQFDSCKAAAIAKSRAGR